MSGTTMVPDSTSRFDAVRMLARTWWLFLLRGVISVAFGVLIFVYPGLGLVAILAFLAAWMLVDGIASLIQAIRDQPDTSGRMRSRLWLALDGVFSLVMAAVLLLLPGLSAVALVLVVGVWAIAVGVVRIIMAWRAGHWLLGLLGLLSVLLGIWLVLAPGPGLVALVWMIAIEAIAIGFLFIAFGWRLRRIAHDPHGPHAIVA